MTMTSKERLLKTLRWEPTDRVPVSTYELVPFGADPWYESEPSYQDLLKLIAEKTDILYLWDKPAKNRCAWDEEYRRWSEGESTFQYYILHTPKGDITRLTRRDRNLNTNWTVEPWFKSIEEIETYYSLPWEFGGVDMSGYQAAESRMGDRGIMLCDTADPVCVMADGLGFETFMIHAWQDGKRLKKCMDIALERLLVEMRYKLEQGAGPLWRIYGPEYVSPAYFPLDAFREFVVDYDKKMIELIHEFGGFARIHAHGRVTQLMDLFLEMGADATDPLEPPPQGDVDLAEVKKKYGERLVLFGNLELSFLEYWEGDAIEQYVKQCMDAAAEGGGYVIMPTASPINAPLWEKTAENYRRFIDAALKYGRYE